MKRILQLLVILLVTLVLGDAPRAGSFQDDVQWRQLTQCLPRNKIGEDGTRMPDQHPATWGYATFVNSSGTVWEWDSYDTAQYHGIYWVLRNVVKSRGAFDYLNDPNTEAVETIETEYRLKSDYYETNHFPPQYIYTGTLIGYWEDRTPVAHFEIYIDHQERVHFIRTGDPWLEGCRLVTYHPYTGAGFCYWKTGFLFGMENADTNFKIPRIDLLTGEWTIYPVNTNYLPEECIDPS